MIVKYTFTDINKVGMMYGVGDLLRYYADISVKLRDKIALLNQDKRVRDKLTNYLRKKTGNVGISVDAVFTAVESATAMGDMFYFLVDNRNMCDFLKDKKQVDIEIHMNNYYFLTNMLLDKFMPTRLSGFRQKYPEGIHGQQMKWMDWFEKEWRKDIKFKGCSNPNFTKEILEE